MGIARPDERPVWSDKAVVAVTGRRPRLAPRVNVNAAPNRALNPSRVRNGPRRALNGPPHRIARIVRTGPTVPIDPIARKRRIGLKDRTGLTDLIVRP